MKHMKHGYKIWRGTESKTPVAYKNTNDFTRRSANTYNLYTLWIDNHEAWKAFPKRSKSLICTTELETAGGYGYPHLIIPADDALIGICPDNDMWRSFQTLELEDHGASLESFIELSMHMLRLMGYNETQVQLHWDKLEEALKETQLDALKVSKNWDWRTEDFYAKRFTFWLKEAGPSLYDVFEKVFDPHKNGFTVRKASQFHAGKNQEVWVQGKVVLINYADMTSGSDYDASEVYEYLNDNGIRIEE